MANGLHALGSLQRTGGDDACDAPFFRVPQRLTRSPEFRLRFPKRVDLRWAIVLPRDSQYSASVEVALRKFRCKHVLTEEGRCAGFALGESRIEGQEATWYITALQSDLAFCASARIRDLLRGWRRVLFSAIVADAKTAGTHRVALPTAEAVAQTVSWWACRNVSGAPPSWLNIYDRTAAEFGMPLEKVTQPVNIQVVPRRRAAMNSAFYVKRLIP